MLFHRFVLLLLGKVVLRLFLEDSLQAVHCFLLARLLPQSLVNLLLRLRDLAQVPLDYLSSILVSPLEVREVVWENVVESH